jgi:hypothetical protein
MKKTILILTLLTSLFSANNYDFDIKKVITDAIKNIEPIDKKYILAMYHTNNIKTKEITVPVIYEEPILELENRIEIELPTYKNTSEISLHDLKVIERENMIKDVIKKTLEKQMTYERNLN